MEITETSFENEMEKQFENQEIELTDAQICALENPECCESCQ